MTSKIIYFLIAFFILFDAGSEELDMTRISYINYEPMFKSCMAPFINIGMDESGEQWQIQAKSCNKFIDQVKYPEMLKGQIPGQSPYTN